MQRCYNNNCHIVTNYFRFFFFVFNLFFTKQSYLFINKTVAAKNLNATWYYFTRYCIPARLFYNYEKPIDSFLTFWISYTIWLLFKMPITYFSSNVFWNKFIFPVLQFHLLLKLIPYSGKIYIHLLVVHTIWILYFKCCMKLTLTIPTLIWHCLLWFRREYSWPVYDLLLCTAHSINRCLYYFRLQLIYFGIYFVFNENKTATQMMLSNGYVVYFNIYNHDLIVGHFFFLNNSTK